MDNNATDITVLMDRSGSMHSIASDMRGGFDKFIEEQQEEPGKAHVTFCQFDTRYDVVYKRKPIKKVPRCVLEPRGATALLDAIGRTIHDTGKRLKKMAKVKRPGKVVFIIITDGLENASREYTRRQINDMITHQEDEYNWKFIFLGANQDAIAEGRTYGMKKGHSMTYNATSGGATNMFESVSKKMSAVRSMSGEEYTASVQHGLFFDEADRKAAVEK